MYHNELTNEEIIKRPIFLTEKANRQQEENNQFVFQVHKDAKKHEVRRAVEELFRVDVKSVNTMIVRGKIKRRGRLMLKKPNWKKAIVTLGPDDQIDFFEGA